MLNIKYINDETSEFNFKRIIVNGIYDKDSYCSELSSKVDVSIYNEKIIALLMNKKINDIFSCFNQLKIPLHKRFYPKSISEVDWSYIKLDNREKGYVIRFKFQYDNEEWRNPYSLKEFGDQMESMCSELDFINYEQDDELISNGFIIWKQIKNIEELLCDLVESYSQEVNSIFDKVIENLYTNNLHNSINFEFSVDNNIKIACEQYLIYFIQFLEDMGIQASSQITNESHKILFSVTPDDPKIALEQIKESLDLYLQLPNYPDALSTSDMNEIAILQLKSNISHLNSQLALAKATIIAQEKTIAALEIMKTEKIINTDNWNEESILNGVVTITEYEQNGFKINFPKLYRLLKRKQKIM